METTRSNKRKGRKKNKSTASSADGSTSPTPVAPNAPKFGTLIPNRIFVGGISPNTTECELQSLFSNYGKVKAAKIILDRAGVSKGYGFVTFETEEEAKRIQKVTEIILRDRKLNIAPAIKKQPFARGYDHVRLMPVEPIKLGDSYPLYPCSLEEPNRDSPPAISNGTILYHNGIPYTYQNGMAFFSIPENVCTYGNPQANFPVIYPSSVYIPQQPFQCPTANAQFAGATIPELAQYIPAPVPAPYFIPDQNY